VSVLLGVLVLVGFLVGEGRGTTPFGGGQAVGGSGAWPGPLSPLVVGILLVGLLLALVVGVFYWRNAYLERTRERLEQQVAERTEEVERQKHQLMVYNRELLRTNEQLRQTVEDKSKLLGVAAHDLKNPLFGIRALSEIVLENEEMGPRLSRKLTLIRASADEAMELIDDLLTSAAGSARSQVDEEPVDLGALAQWVVRSFEPHAQHKDQALRCAVADEACVVSGDKRKLREAIANLVSNALKYSPHGEAVDVSVYEEEGSVAVEVADAGPGLSENDQKRMFAAFQRLTPTPTGDESSSGLGLYIVKQVVDLHGGDIEVDTALGAGSTFRIAFPAAEDNGTSVPAADPPQIREAT
jgi:signal transduction histidine kinase